MRLCRRVLYSVRRTSNMRRTPFDPFAWERKSPHKRSTNDLHDTRCATPKGEDCLTCAAISGTEGQFGVSFARDGRTIVEIRSYDSRSRDAQGNTVGASLGEALGSTSVQCNAGMDTTCASPSLKGLWYIVAE